MQLFCDIYTEITFLININIIIYKITMIKFDINYKMEVLYKRGVKYWFKILVELDERYKEIREKIKY